MSGSAPDLSLRPRPLTNGAEITAYIAAHVIKIAAAYASAPFYFPALYQWLRRIGAVPLLLGINAAISLLWIALALALFLILREAFGGVPAIIRSVHHGGARSTASFEFGAYAVAQFLGLAVSMVLFSTAVPQLYARFDIHAQGFPGVYLPALVSLGIAVVVTAIVFVVFINLRRAFSNVLRPA